MSTSVGFIGLGTMGRPMARHLHSQLSTRGDRLLVRDLDPSSVAELEALGALAADAEDLAGCAALVAMVPDLPQLEPLLEEIHPHLRTPVTVVVCSTVSPTAVTELAERWHAATDGLVRVVDAPVSGGEEGAVAGTLSIMVGGADEDVAAVTTHLEAMGTPVHFGPLGTGSIAKACNQMIVAATLVSLGEVAVIAERSGLDLDRLLALLEGGLAGSRVLQTKRRRLVEEDYTVSGPAKFLVKDLTFAADAAHEAGLDAHQLDLTREFFADLTDAGFGDQDTAVVRAYLERRNPR